MHGQFEPHFVFGFIFRERNAFLSYSFLEELSGELSGELDIELTEFAISTVRMYATKFVYGVYVYPNKETGEVFVPESTKRTVQKLADFLRTECSYNVSEAGFILALKGDYDRADRNGLYPEVREAFAFINGIPEATAVCAEGEGEGEGDVVDEEK